MIDGIIKLPNKPQGEQVKYWRLDSRFTAACVGRQFGKSTIAMGRSIRNQLESTILAWWVSPIVPQAKVQFKRAVKYYRPIITRVNKSDMEIELFNGSIWQFKGSDDPESLKGDTLDHATLDECAKMRPEVFPEVVRPMLAVKKGTADLIGTPKGKNWFYDICRNAKVDDEWSYFHATSLDSPFFDATEFEKIRQTTPEAIFNQEYMAEFIDDGGEVFHNYRDCIYGELEPPIFGRRYIMGVDLAKYNDWTVLTVWDIERKHLVAFKRFNQIDWNIQEQHIYNLALQYNKATLSLDATGVGDPIYERLNRLGLTIYPTKFNNENKAQIIENLIFAIEKREITFPPIPELLHELSVFSIERTGMNRIRYTAPSGQHDDIVISMALANHLLSRQIEYGVRQL